jgi:hypothetical protein
MHPYRRFLSLAAVCSAAVGLAFGPLAPSQGKDKDKESEYLKQVQTNLKDIGLALIHYADNNRDRLPANAIYDKKGKALLSWRVAILPYIEEDKLYKEFKLDEPWDSKHNKALLKKMPKIYAPVGLKTKVAHGTFYQGFVGKGAIFEGKEGIKYPAAITGGTSNTIMIVEAAKAVPWSKPEDLPYDPKNPLPKLGALSKDRFNTVFADGSVHSIKKKINPKTLHLLITRNDGMVPGDYDD